MPAPAPQATFSLHLDWRNGYIPITTSLAFADIELGIPPKIATWVRPCSVVWNCKGRRKWQADGNLPCRAVPAFERSLKGKGCSAVLAAGDCLCRLAEAVPLRQVEHLLVGFDCAPHTSFCVISHETQSLQCAIQCMGVALEFEGNAWNTKP